MYVYTSSTNCMCPDKLQKRKDKQTKQTKKRQETQSDFKSMDAATTKFTFQSKVFPFSLVHPITSTNLTFKYTLDNKMFNQSLRQSYSYIHMYSCKQYYLHITSKKNNNISTNCKTTIH